jgi:hypothetical protein
VRVGGVFLEKKRGWVMMLFCFVREDVKMVGGHLRSLVPKRGGKRGMGKEGADHVVNGSDFTHDFPIFRGGVRTGKTEDHTILSAELVETFIVVFGAIITLDEFNGTDEFNGDKFVKVKKDREDR